MKEREAGVRKGLNLRRGRRKEKIDPDLRKREEGLSPKKEGIDPSHGREKEDPDHEKKRTGRDPETNMIPRGKVDEADPDLPKK